MYRQVAEWDWEWLGWRLEEADDRLSSSLSTVTVSLSDLFAGKFHCFFSQRGSLS